MSDSSSLSDNAGAEILDMVRPAPPSSQNLTPNARLKQTKTPEPSPASTFGDSASDGSGPATPQSSSVHDIVKGTNNLSLTKVDTSAQAKLVQGSKCLMLGEHDSPGLLTQQSPSKGAREATSNRSTSAVSSPDAEYLHQTRKSPLWCTPHANTFVRSSGSTDDPFVTTSSPVQPSLKDVTGTDYHVREDRASDPPTPDTAQAHFSPNACVFVANLLQTADDEQLENAVTATFSHFGQVYVKIRRDSRGMPYAFAQYETEAQALRAITEGRNVPILGRHCRTEIAKVNRTLYLSKIAGGEISHQEARDLLKEYGAIEEMHYASATDRALYGLPQGIFVRFHFYDDCRDAQISFRIHDGYRLEQAKITEDMRTTMISRSASRRSPQTASPGFSNTSPGRYLPPSPNTMGLKCDDCSIFIGNLPPHVNEPRMHDRFAMFGQILGIVICAKPLGMRSTGTSTTFAFVEYSTRAEASNAVLRASRQFDGFQIRVEHKVPRRLLANSGESPTSTNQVQKPQTPAQAQEMMMMIYRRGVEAGMNHAAQSLPIASQGMAAPTFPPCSQLQFRHPENDLGLYNGTNGASPTSGLGPQSYHNGNVNGIAANTVISAEGLQPSTTSNFVQSGQDNSGYAQSLTTKEDGVTYAWPMSGVDHGFQGMSFPY